MIEPSEDRLSPDGSPWLDSRAWLHSELDKLGIVYPSFVPSHPEPSATPASVISLADERRKRLERTDAD